MIDLVNTHVDFDKHLELIMSFLNEVLVCWTNDQRIFTWNNGKKRQQSKNTLGKIDQKKMGHIHLANWRSDIYTTGNWYQ